MLLKILIFFLGGAASLFLGCSMRGWRGWGTIEDVWRCAEDVLRRRNSLFSKYEEETYDETGACAFLRFSRLVCFHLVLFSILVVVGLGRGRLRCVGFCAGKEGEGGVELGGFMF